MDPNGLKKSDLPHFLDLKSDLEEAGALLDDEADSDDKSRESSDQSISSIYKMIQDNKAKGMVGLDISGEDERPDPGFRIFHVDQETGEHREVPPYTSPGEFLDSIKNDGASRRTVGKEPETASTSQTDYDTTTTYDGYQSIVESASKDDDIGATMRQARMKNRGLDGTPISYPAVNGDSYVNMQNVTDDESIHEKDLSNVYDKIRRRKAETKAELSDASPDDRPDPGFRIYHVDSETGEHREVPPYTSPGEFLESIKSKGGQPAEEAVQSGQGDVSLDHDGVPTLHETPRTNGATRSSPRPKEYKENPDVQHPDEKTYDGYQDIIQSSSSLPQKDALEAMREARRKNRLGTTGVDENKLDGI
jgi:hypothetical protein